MDKTYEVDLQEIISILRRKIWLIVACAVLGGFLMLSINALFVKPKYQSSVRIYVNNSVNKQNPSGITSADLVTSQRLVTTYISILKSNTVLEMVAQEAQVNFSTGMLLKMITASAIEETEVFQVWVSDTDPERAARIANAIATVAPDAIANIVEGSSTKVIDYARVASKPYAPDYVKNTLIGVAIGALLAMVLSVLRFLLDVHINTEEDLSRISSAPILGIIPDFEAEYKHDYTSDMPGGAPVRR